MADWLHMRHSMPHFIVFPYFISLGRYCDVFFPHKWKALLLLGMTIGVIFLTFAHFVSLCQYFGNSSSTSNFSLIYLLWWSMILNFTIVIILGYHKPCFIRWYLDKCVCVLNDPPIGLFPTSLLSFGPPYSETGQYWKWATE